MDIQKVSLKSNVLLIMYLLFSITTIAVAQKNTTVQLLTQFADPHYNPVANTYSIDIEMTASGTAQQLFGMNLRFFYDVSKLEVDSVSNLHPSYEMLGGPLMHFVGNAASGVEMFSFEDAAAYVNGGIQLANVDAPLDLVPNQWAKVGTLHFSVPSVIAAGTRLCPSLIWDLQADPANGGFFPGDDGVVITVVENDPATPEVSAPANVSVQAFNWEYANSSGKPYGQPKDEECFTVGVVSTNNVVSNSQGYALYQNYPNPFADNTAIEFVLPKAEEARLVFCDVMGKVIHAIQNDYVAGQHVVNIHPGLWSLQGSILFYRLETAAYTSPTLKMTVTGQ